jgi:hypothetical protein
MPPVLWQLSPAAVRVLGSLLEKETSTPEYYPLSLLALTNACNQKSSRYPVMDLSEDEVRTALHELEEAGLVSPARGNEGRVTKYAHHIGEVFNLRRGEVAVLCILLLRGPQTTGELRSRTERLHNFAALGEVESTLQQLAMREPPLARALPREAGARETRYVHLLSPVGLDMRPSQRESSDESAASARVAALEEEIAELRARVGALEDKLAQLAG